MGWGGCAEEFPASPFPQLCKGLINYGWCLEQSRAKRDPTNSSSSLGRPVLLRRNPHLPGRGQRSPTKFLRRSRAARQGLGGAPEADDAVCVHRWRGPSSVTVTLASPTGDEDT